MAVRMSETTRKEKAKGRVITARKSTRMRTQRKAMESKRMGEHKHRKQRKDKCFRKRKDLANGCDKQKRKKRQRGKSRLSWTVLAVTEHGRDV
jgi:hypothetical protein